MTEDVAARDGTFAEFMAVAEVQLRRALVGAYGPQVGREAAVNALAWAWEHWDRVVTMENPIGYLYRVGQSEARTLNKRTPDRGAPIQDMHEALVEPGLDAALTSLTEHQRVAVVLCFGFEWTHREVAELLDISASTVQNHVERGLAKLRAHIGGENDG